MSRCQKKVYISFLRGSYSDDVTAKKLALVLVNLGTPNSPTEKDVRTYLREFLMDPRIIEMPKVLWWPILEGIILRVRPKRSAALYRKVWMDEGSPLLHYTKVQAQLLASELGVKVVPAMRYGQPALGDVLDELMAEGYRDIGVIPAYPQYSATTIGSINDALAQWLLTHRVHPQLRIANSYPAAPEYIDALESAVRQSWAENGQPDFDAGDRLILSFHSIPVAMDEAGDPYKVECLATAAAVRKRLGLSEKECLTTFQSVFGKAEWIGPATIDTVKELGARQTRRVDVICPGFVADCLETLEEIDQLNRETFLDAGGKGFTYIPWGNGYPGAIRAIAAQAREIM